VVAENVPANSDTASTPSASTVAHALESFVAARMAGEYRAGAELDVASGNFALNVGPFRVPFPNPGKLAIHDVHHVALGVPATFWGEVQVSAFELRSGAPTALIWLLCVGALGLGFVVRPARVAGWIRAYRGCTNLYREPDLASLLSLDVTALRARLGIR
jgi:hypothetical protein